MNGHDAPTPCLFFCKAFEIFDMANFFSSVKIALAVLQLMYLGTHRIFFNTLYYGRSVKGNHRDSERTGKIAPSVLKLSSSFTDPYLLAEFSLIGRIQLILLSICS